MKRQVSYDNSFDLDMLEILPKNYDPNVAPDPERWLPKFERSTYKKKKDKRQRDREVGRGTQGAATVATEL